MTGEQVNSVMDFVSFGSLRCGQVREDVWPQVGCTGMTLKKEICGKYGYFSLGYIQSINLAIKHRGAVNTLALDATVWRVYFTLKREWDHNRHTRISNI